MNPPTDPEYIEKVNQAFIESGGRYVTATDLARHAGVQVSQVTRTCEAGRLLARYVKKSSCFGYWYIPMTEFERWKALDEMPGYTIREASEVYGIPEDSLPVYLKRAGIETVRIPLRGIIIPQSAWPMLESLAEQYRANKEDREKRHGTVCPVCGKQFFARLWQGKPKAHCSRACRHADPVDRAARSAASKASPRVQANWARVQEIRRQRQKGIPE